MLSLTRGGWLAVLIFAVLVLVVTLQLFGNPNLGWDTLGYVAAIEQLYSDDPAVIHARAYDGLRQIADETTFARLTGATNVEYLGPSDVIYRQVVYADAEAFSQNIAFYAIRPAYWGLALALSGVGLNVFVATWLISNICYALLCLGCFLFLQERTTPVYALLCASLIAFYPPLLSVAAASNPDAMLALFFLGFFLLFLSGRLLPACLLLLAAVFVRTDIAVFNVLFAVLLAFRQHPAGVKWGAIALLLLSAFVAHGIHDHFGFLGWARIFQFALVKYVPYPEALPTSVAPEVYLATLGEALVSAVGRKWVWVTAAAVTIYAALRRLRPWRLDALLRLRETVGGARPEDVMLVAILLYLAARLILFPALWPRLYVGQVVVLLLCASTVLYEVYGAQLTKAVAGLKSKLFGVGPRAS